MIIQRATFLLSVVLHTLWLRLCCKETSRISFQTNICNHVYQLHGCLIDAKLHMLSAYAGAYKGQCSFLVPGGCKAFNWCWLLQDHFLVSTEPTVGLPPARNWSWLLQSLLLQRGLERKGQCSPWLPRFCIILHLMENQNSHTVDVGAYNSGK